MGDMIKNYKRFLESDNKLWVGIQHEYSIYDFFEDLKRYQWITTTITPINEKSIKFWTEHFIGNGYYQKIENRVVSILNAISKADIDYVNDRMYDVFDNYLNKKSYCIGAVLYGDFENYDKPIRNRYNGSISVKDPKDRKLDIIIHLLKSIIQPTLYISYPSINLRMGKDEKFVTDEKYQCSNFKIENHILHKDALDNKYPTEMVSVFDFNKKKKYDIDKIIDMYQPGIYVTIGGHQSDTKNPINLRQIEKEIDDVLVPILPELDYKEVIFDVSRYDRKFDDNTNVYDYTFKILLNL